MTTIRAAQRTVIPHKKTGGRSPASFDPPALKVLQTSGLLLWPSSPVDFGGQDIPSPSLTTFVTIFILCFAVTHSTISGTDWQLRWLAADSAKRYLTKNGAPKQEVRTKDVSGRVTDRPWNTISAAIARKLHELIGAKGSEFVVAPRSSDSGLKKPP